MGNLLINSIYYQKFIDLADLSEVSKKSYTYPLKELGVFIKNSGYNRDELDFDKFYYSEEDDDYEPIDLEFVEKYVEYLKENKTKIGLGSHLSTVKTFFRFIEGIDLIQDNPFTRYPASFRYIALKNRALSREESDRLLNSAALLDPFSLQYFVLMLMQFTCGLRSKELCSLRLSQINFDLEVIAIDIGQKTYSSSVLMTPALIQYLKAYIEHPYFTKWLGDKTDKELFFYQNKQLTNTILNKILKEIATKAKIQRKVTSHDTRATMAYLMDQNGFSLQAIQRQMRHKKPSTTLLYLPMKNRLED